MAVLREPQSETVLFGAGPKLCRRESFLSTRLSEIARFQQNHSCHGLCTGQPVTRRPNFYKRN
jgi:hypothetical protein